MAISLSNFVNNLSEGVYKIRRKYRHNDKKCETCRITYKLCDCFLEYTNFIDDFIETRRLCCNKNYQQVWWKVKGTIFNTYKFS